MRRLHRRQVATIPAVPTGSGITGAATLDTDGVNTVSLLADSGATGDAAITTPMFTTTTPTSTSSVATSSTAEASASSGSSKSIPVGTVIGICVGVFGVLAAIILLFLYFGSKRRLEKQVAAKGFGKEVERRRSGRELWVKMDEKDNDGDYDKYAIKRTTMLSAAPSAGTGLSSVGRSITVKSAKSARTFKSLGYGTNLGLSDTFKTPDLPPHLDFTDSDMGSGRGFVSSVIPPPFARTDNPISWDGETVAEGSSYLSLERGQDSMQYATVKKPVSPFMVVSHQTPPAIETKEHQWEKAEVVSPEGAEAAYAGVDEPRHPYAARLSQETIRNPPAHSEVRPPTNPFDDQNPFDDRSAGQARSIPQPQSAGTSDSDSLFTTHSDLTVRTGAFAVAAAAATGTHHERVDSNEHAMASLIAALNISQEEARERLSAAIMLTPRQSAMSELSVGAHSMASKDSEALDEASIEEFPLPPTDIARRKASP